MDLESKFWTELLDKFIGLYNSKLASVGLEYININHFRQMKFTFVVLLTSMTYIISILNLTFILLLGSSDLKITLN